MSTRELERYDSSDTLPKSFPVRLLSDCYPASEHKDEAMDKVTYVKPGATVDEGV
jgi:hypothetical protein